MYGLESIVVGEVQNSEFSTIQKQENPRDTGPEQGSTTSRI